MTDQAVRARPAPEAARPRLLGSATPHAGRPEPVFLPGNCCVSRRRSLILRALMRAATSDAPWLSMRLDLGNPIEKPRLALADPPCLRLRRDSRRTEGVYVGWIRRYVPFQTVGERAVHRAVRQAGLTNRHPGKPSGTRRDDVLDDGYDIRIVPKGTGPARSPSYTADSRSLTRAEGTPRR